MRNRSICVALALSLLAAAQAGAAEAKVVKQDLFVSGTHGYHTFRIPALIVTKKGTVLAFCEGRKSSRSDHGNIDLLMRRSTTNGLSWGKIRMLHEEGGDKKVTIGNPCPVIDQSTGVIWLTLCRNNVDVLVMHSKDDGVTWSKPVDITKSVKSPKWTWYATGPGVGIQLQRGKYKGRLVIPCDHGEKIKGRRVMFSHVFYSDDHGKSWRHGSSLDRHTDECQVIERLDGTLLINMRNYWGRAGGRPDRGSMRAVATSKDGGQTWSKLRFHPQLIEPVCQASLIQYPKPIGGASNPLIFANPASKNQRCKLTIRLSIDEGRSWGYSRLLHPTSSAYSCLTVLSDGTVACLFEGGRGKKGYDRLILARFPVKWIMGKDK